MNDKQKIAFGVALGSLLSMLPIILLYENQIGVLGISTITIFSLMIYSDHEQ